MALHRRYNYFGMKLFHASILIIIILLSVFLHVVNIEKPSMVVFDELYFTTGAAGYASRTPYFDIHPPLGKILYSLPLIFDGKNYGTDNYKFVTFEYDKKSEEIKTLAPRSDYDDFPYIALRLISAFFGIVLVVAIYLFLTTLTTNRLVPLLGALFITLDTALLIETRLILLNGMYLAFGFLALWALFKNRSSPILSGILLGFALSVKLVAIVFIAPIILGIFITRDGKASFLSFRNAVKSLFMGMFILFLFVFVINNLLLPADGRVDFYNSTTSLKATTSTDPMSPFAFLNPIGSYVGATSLELTMMISGYTTGESTYPMASKWYQWILMKKHLWLFTKSDVANPVFMFYVGNYIVWFGALGAIILTLIALGRNFIKKITDTRINTILLLFGSYIFALLPFSLIERPSFIYHYVPALLFGVCILSLILGWYLERKTKMERCILLGIIVTLTIFGFLLATPYIYGIHLFPTNY